MKTAALIAIATSTTASGGLAVISHDSPVTMALFLGGISVVAGCAYYLGQKANDLKRMWENICAVTAELKEIKERLAAIERRHNREDGHHMAKTQKIEIENED
jgi:hypothetical protein